jgi:hypothetical protein
MGFHRPLAVGALYPTDLKIVEKFAGNLEFGAKEYLT